MIRVAELVCRVVVERPDEDSSGELPLALASDVAATLPRAYEEPSVEPPQSVAGTPPAATLAPVDPRLIADLVYKLMRDELALGHERE